MNSVHKYYLACLLPRSPNHIPTDRVFRWRFRYLKRYNIKKDISLRGLSISNGKRNQN